MKFTHYDLGYFHGGEIVEVRLSGTEANVMLLDTVNFNAYRNDRQFQYYGGHFTTSPVRIKVPYSAYWHVVVDLGGYVGTVQSSIRVLS